jgi:type I restriction enzyme, R subunit
MSVESEYTLENRMISRLVSSGYEHVKIHDESTMLANLKIQLEKHNKTSFSEKEYERVLNHLSASGAFECAKKLRDKFQLQRDDNTFDYIEFFDSEAWCKNQYQVTNQVTMIGKRKNRYDVTLLINGLPLVQIELKKRGVELKQAFNQIGRYHRDSYRGLFTYTQMFVISNGVNTKYFANSKGQPYSNTFHWTDEKNVKINELEKFTEVFLEKCHLSKMIAKYTVLHETTKKIMVLRPYQYYATEKIINHVQINPTKNGYIWHTTGSGKTLTSFKTSQILSTSDKIDKILFVVDRKDLDYQTIKEFKAFSKDSVENTKNTRNLEQQLSDDKIKLVVTTIQKLNNAISKERYQKKMQRLRDKKFVIIFDECHRTQFGDTHKRIDEFFNNKQFFGFTGTPIFRENNIKGRTTKELFGDCLHRYLIKDAIDDENVLDFSVEYISTFKSPTLLTDENDIDVDDFDQVSGIDKRQVFDNEIRLKEISKHIVDIHSRKTYSKEFTAIFAVSSVKIAIKYYEIFRELETNLKIASIFTYNPNEAQVYASDVDDEVDENYEDTRDKLERMVRDFNKNFGTNHDLDKENGFNAYYVDISKKVKERKIDILIVVNMFLTGFDSKPLNTMYVDKNLKHHGLIQAFSRTNRTLDEKKKHGNIVCFRNLKKRTDNAITLFSDEDAIETVLKKSYEFYKNLINDLIYELLRLAPTAADVDKLQGDEEVEFVKSFRDVLRTLNVIETFREFTYDDLRIDEQTVEDYKSKYLDIYEKVKKGEIVDEKASILDDISFEIELIRRDHINVQYILDLLANLDKNSDSYEADKKHIFKIIDTSEKLRSKKELIKKFIDENLIEANDGTDVEAELHSFMESEKIREINEYANKENLSAAKISGVITYYEFTNRIDHDKIKGLSKEPLKFLERTKKIPLWETFINSLIEKYTW